MRLTDEIEPHLEEYLALERAASLPYATFIWGPSGQSDEIQRHLYAAKGSEFAPPHAQIALTEDEPVGILCCLLGSELKRARLASALVLARSDAVRSDPSIAARLKLAARVMWKPEPMDFYLSRIAVAPERRGEGVARWLMERFLEKARATGAKRCLLEVYPGNEAARALYSRAGFVSERTAETVDNVAGRRLIYEHFALSL